MRVKSLLTIMVFAVSGLMVGEAAAEKGTTTSGLKVNTTKNVKLNKAVKLNKLNKKTTDSKKVNRSTSTTTKNVSRLKAPTTKNATFGARGTSATTTPSVKGAKRDVVKRDTSKLTRPSDPSQVKNVKRGETATTAPRVGDSKGSKNTAKLGDKRNVKEADSKKIRGKAKIKGKKVKVAPRGLKNMLPKKRAR